MISQYLGSDAGLISMSLNQFTQIKNKQNQNQVLGLLSGLPSINQGNSGPFSSGFFNQVYDAKLMTPKVIDNYLRQVDEVMGGTNNNIPISTTADYQSFVDKMLTEKNGTNNENTNSDPENIESEGAEDNSSEYEFFGIVGEIFDKYA